MSQKKQHTSFPCFVFFTQIHIHKLISLFQHSQHCTLPDTGPEPGSPKGLNPVGSFTKMCCKGTVSDRKMSTPVKKKETPVKSFLGEYPTVSIS